MRSETARNNVPDRTKGIITFCTMESSRNHVAIPPTDRMAAAGFTQHKSPSLAEAYKHFTGKDLVGAHDALVDVLATIEIYEHVRNNNTSIQS